MRSVSTKLLKFLLFIGIVIYMFHYQSEEPFLTRILFALFIGGLAYISASLYGFALSVSGNYLIAAIVMLVIYVAIFLGVDKLQNSVSWLSDELLMIIICALMALNIAGDILYVKAVLFPTVLPEVTSAQKYED